MTDFTFSIYNNDVTIASNFLLLVTNWVVLYYTSKRRTRNFTDVHVLTFKLLQFPLILTSAHHAQYPHLICGFACLPNGSNAIVMRLWCDFVGPPQGWSSLQSVQWLMKCYLMICCHWQPRIVVSCRVETINHNIWTENSSRSNACNLFVC